MQSRWFSEKGQSAVEFALIVPVLALMLVVISDFGRIFFIGIAVNNAARAGAQYGSQTNTTAADWLGMVSEALADGANIPNFQYANRVAVHLWDPQSADYSVRVLQSPDLLCRRVVERGVCNGRYFSNF